MDHQVRNWYAFYILFLIIVTAYLGVYENAKIILFHYIFIEYHSHICMSKAGIYAYVTHGSPGAQLVRFLLTFSHYRDFIPWCLWKCKNNFISLYIHRVSFRKMLWAHIYDYHTHSLYTPKPTKTDFIPDPRRSIGRPCSYDSPINELCGTEKVFGVL